MERIKNKIKNNKKYLRKINKMIMKYVDLEKK